ncbi:hypothetical protein ARMSODRAFT_962005 [Armillaria solidipes]|uniref:Uncharacterized protein n=1 Tax=Armillaria solidipes TaxID=1076256 RepID=A0A2H3BEM0_9AGAR|nr:hypothetical protein ARMSODRAFT_962005 [Armillaria solidipes]
MDIIASPFHKLLTSNDCPTEEDVQNITRFCAEPAERIRNLDVEIADLQERFNSLISNARSLQSQLRVDEHLPSSFMALLLPREAQQSLLLHVSEMNHHYEEVSNIIDVELINLQEMIQTASSEREAVQSKFLVSEHLAILSPIRRLPTELLQEIFLRCIDDKPFRDICPEGGYASEAPVIFGRVCSRWRTVSFSTPSLWSSLKITVSRVAGAVDWAAPGSRKIIRAWLKRSGRLPLDACLSASQTSSAAELRDVIYCLGLPHCYRWRRIILTLPVGFIDHTVFDNLCFPLLEKFVLYICPSPVHGPTALSNLAFLERAHLLREFKITTTTAALTGLPRAPWHHLVDIHIDVGENWTFPESELRKALVQCVKLESLLLRTANHRRILRGPQSTSSQRVTLPSLRKFHVSGREPSLTTWLTLSHIFDNLDLPRLENLDIRGRSTGRLWERTHLQSFLSLNNLLNTSACPLTTLSLDEYISVPSHILLQCLSRVPTLHKLTVQQRRDCGRDLIVDDNFLKALTPGMLCPKLQVLILVDSGAYQEDTLVELLRARCAPPAGVAKLQEASISSHRPRSHTDEQIRDLGSHFTVHRV